MNHWLTEAKMIHFKAVRPKVTVLQQVFFGKVSFFLELGLIIIFSLGFVRYQLQECPRSYRQLCESQEEHKAAHPRQNRAPSKIVSIQIGNKGWWWLVSFPNPLAIESEAENLSRRWCGFLCTHDWLYLMYSTLIWRPPGKEERSQQSGKFLGQLVSSGRGPWSALDYIWRQEYFNNLDQNILILQHLNKSKESMRWKCSHRYIDIGYILLFKGILRHGSEMGLWSILDGGGGRLRLLGQPGRDVGQAAEDVVTILTFEVLIISG